MKCIVTRAFQFKGSMRRTGEVIEVTADEAKTPFVAAHVKMGGEKPDSQPSNNFTNGTEKAKGEKTPGAIARDGAKRKMTADEMKTELQKAGVPVPPNTTKAELQELWANFAEAVAGSPDGGNAPETKQA